MQIQKISLTGEAQTPVEQDANISNADLLAAVASVSGEACAIAGLNLEQRNEDFGNIVINAVAVQGNIIKTNLVV